MADRFADREAGGAGWRGGGDEQRLMLYVDEVLPSSTDPKRLVFFKTLLGREFRGNNNNE